MMLYIPIYAFLAKLVFLKKKKFNYAEHLVIFAYVLSQISIISVVFTIGCAIFGVSIGAMAMFIIPMQIIYSAYCLKQLYALSMEGIILRTLLFFLILGIFFVIATVITSVIMYKSGALEEVIKAQKAAQNVSYIISSVINWTS